MCSSGPIELALVQVVGADFGGDGCVPFWVGDECQVNLSEFEGVVGTAGVGGVAFPVSPFCGSEYPADFGVPDDDASFADVAAVSWLAVEPAFAWGFLAGCVEEVLGFGGREAGAVAEVDVHLVLLWVSVVVQCLH